MTPKQFYSDHFGFLFVVKFDISMYFLWFIYSHKLLVYLNLPRGEYLKLAQKISGIPLLGVHELLPSYSCRNCSQFWLSCLVFSNELKVCGTVELSRRSMARPLLICKGHDMR